MENTKPTAADVVKYLTARGGDDRKFFVSHNTIFEQFPGSEPFPYGFMEEVYWMKDGIIGSRGYALWPFDNAPIAKAAKKVKYVIDPKPAVPLMSLLETPAPQATIPVIPTPAPATPQVGSKAARALAIVKANPTASTKELIALVMKDCSMSEAGARTYVYNAKKSLG